MNKEKVLIICIVLLFIATTISVNQYLKIKAQKEELCSLTNRIINGTNMCTNLLGQAYNESFTKLDYVRCE